MDQPQDPSEITIYQCDNPGSLTEILEIIHKAFPGKRDEEIRLTFGYVSLIIWVIK